MKNLKLWPVCLTLIVLLAPILLTAPARAAAPAKERRGTLCGQLAFLTQQRTGQRLLGLIPCGSSRPIIFIARPGKLYNYYRFSEVTISKGDRIITEEYGAIENFIEKFDSFVEIQDCRSCQAKAPTRTPIPRRASLNCGETLLQNGQTIFPELADAGWQAQTLEDWETYAAGNELFKQCGQDGDCQAQAAMLRIGETLGQRLERTPQRRDQVIEFLYEQLLMPGTGAVCPDFAWSLRFIAAGLSRQGFAIDVLAVASPATLIVTDRSGRQAGLLANGATVEEIPGSKTAVTGQNKVALLPGGLFVEASSAEGESAQMVVTWTANGAARLELAINRTDEVWLASFADAQFDAGGWAALDLAGEPPWLQMVPPGGSIEAPSGAVAASAFTKLSVEESWLPTPTPWPSATPWLPTATGATSATPDQPDETAPAATAVAQALPSATPIPAATPTPATPSGAPSACPLAVALPLALVGLWGMRKTRQKRT